MKLKFTILILVLLLFSACTQQENNIPQTPISNPQSQEPDLKIVAFGDSLTEGFGINKSDSYPSILQKELDNLGYNVKVFNSGLSGETSSGALSRVDWVLNLNPDIVILTIGANDAIRGIDLELTKSNIEQIVDTIQAKEIQLIFSGMEIYENLGENYVNEFRQLYIDIAQEKQLNFIPLFLEGVAGNSSLNIADEIHPNRKGYEIVVRENILPILIPLIDEQLANKSES